MIKNLILTVFIVLCMVSSVYADGVTLSWDAPTENTDHTELIDLGGFIIYYGLVSGEVNYTDNVDVGNVTTSVLPLPDDGKTYYINVVAYDLTKKNHSDFNGEVSFTTTYIDTLCPKPASNLRVVPDEPALLITE